MNQAAPQNSTVVAKFGGTSVADFEAMNRSADVVLANPQVRTVVLSASAGVTNLLVAPPRVARPTSAITSLMRSAASSTPSSIASRHRW